MIAAAQPQSLGFTDYNGNVHANYTNFCISIFRRKNEISFMHKLNFCEKNNIKEFL